MDYEYGIHRKNATRSEDREHRAGMTLEEAINFFSSDGDESDINWHEYFKIVRRPLGEWEDLK